MSAFREVGRRPPLTWSDEGPGADGRDAATHVNGSDLCGGAVRLLPSFQRAVWRSGLAPRRDLSGLAGALDQWGGLNGHWALLQTESLQGLALRGGRGRHLLAADGKVLNLILVEGKTVVLLWLSVVQQGKYSIGLVQSAYLWWGLRGAFWLDGSNGGSGGKDELWGQRDGSAQASGNLDKVTLLGLRGIAQNTTTPTLKCKLMRRKSTKFKHIK